MSRHFRQTLAHMAIEILQGLTHNPNIFGGKPIMRGRRLTVEHVLSMLEAGDTAESILDGYLWLERDDIKACVAFVGRSNTEAPY